MKNIILLRHGKSSWDTPGVADVDRPLLAKGQKRTVKMARYLLEHGISVDLIVTSHAIRAFQTAGIMAEILGVNNHSFITERDLYHASTDEIWDLIVALPEEANHVMLCGHNPGFTEFANQAGNLRLDWLPTSGVASITFPCDHWHECPSVTPSKHFVLWPAKLS